MRKIIIILIVLLMPTICWATNWCNHANNVGCFLMEDSDSETDAGGNTENTLTVSAGDTIPQSSDKKFGTYSRDFERGDTEYLSHADGLATDLNGANQQMTIVAWIKAETVGGGVTYGIVTKYNSTGNQRQYSFWIDDTGPIEFFKSADGSTFQTELGSTSISTGTWYHVAAVYDDVNLTVYLNGNADCAGACTADNTGIFNGTSTFNIGLHPTSSYFDGLIDEVAIFNTALTQSQIQDIMNNGLLGGGTYIYNSELYNSEIYSE